jgi:uncharacterized membrane protein
MTRLRSWWLELQGSLWFLPSVMLCAAVALAVALVELQGVVTDDLSAHWPRLFGAGANGARAMLAAIATSMITVTGVVFSITVVALSLATSQYSPRLLRNFMSDRPTQAVLGAFVSIFAYCLIVLRTIRSPDEGDFVPSIAVLGGVVMAFVGVGLLVYYVHHVASSIQVSSVLSRISTETAAAIDRLFPASIGEPAPATTAAGAPGAIEWAIVRAGETGYLVGVDGDELLARAQRRDLVVRIVPQVGDYLVEGLPLLEVPSGAGMHRDEAKKLAACVTIAAQRTVHQDAPFGFQQIVDVALKALSPSVHDPSTAITCIDHLGALLFRLADRPTPAPCRADKSGTPRVIAKGPDYASLVALSFDAITHHVGSHGVVYARLIDTIGYLADVTSSAERRVALARQIRALVERIGSADLTADSREALARAARRVLATLAV